MSKVIRYRVLGMHCASCELWLEDVLSQVESVQKVKASHTTNIVEITTGENQNDEFLTQNLQKALLTRPEYRIEPDRESLADTQTTGEGSSYLEWVIPVGLAFVTISIFIGLQTLAMLPFLSGSSVITYPLIFMIGLLASVSTCATTTGSLVLGLSATFEKENPKKAAYALWIFHASRIGAFFVFGGLLGLFGGALALGFRGEQVLRLGAQVFLLFLGLNLLGLSLFERFLPKLPKFLSSRTFSVTRSNSYISPLLLGGLTFLLPCGFTQSMQLQALESGSFSTGALTMVIFALGTFPVLFGISRLSAFLGNQKIKKLFYRTAGLIVVAFALWEISIAIKVLFFI